MLILIDTEFTDLLEPELLSLGMVSIAEPADEFYAEVDLQSDEGKTLVARSTSWVAEGVLPQWGAVAGATGSHADLGRRAGEWLLAIHRRYLPPAGPGGQLLEVGFDYSTDYELLEYAIRDAGLWDQVREIVRPVNVGPTTSSRESNLAAEACFAQLRSRNLRRHHALADALALRAGYLAVQARLASAFEKPE